MTAEQAARQAYLDDVIDVVQFEADLEAALWHNRPRCMSFESRQYLSRFTPMLEALKETWTDAPGAVPPYVAVPTEQR